MGALFTLLTKLFRRGGRKMLTKAITRWGPGSAVGAGNAGNAAAGGAAMRGVLGRQVAAGAAGFAAFDAVLGTILGEGSPEQEIMAANKDLMGYGGDVSPGETPDIQELLAMIGDQSPEDVSGLFL